MSSDSAELGEFLEDLRVFYPNALTQRDFLLCIESQEKELERVKSAAKNLIAQKGRHNTEIAYKHLAEVCK